LEVVLLYEKIEDINNFSVISAAIYEGFDNFCHFDRGLRDILSNLGRQPFGNKIC